MKRLTTNKPTDAMSMVELAHNSCFAKNDEVYYRDYYKEISARDLVRKLALKYADIKLPDNDNEFDEEMLDNLQYDINEDPIGLIAVFYRNIWAQADLYEILKKYEEVEEKNINKWIKVEYHYVTDKERKEENIPEHILYRLDCLMPDDEQEILIVGKYNGEYCTRFDICLIDDGYALDSGIEWTDVVAWMPMPTYSEKK